MALTSPNSSALLPGPATTRSGSVGRPRLPQYEAAASRSLAWPATGPYEVYPEASASASRSSGWAGRPASPNPIGSTGSPRRRLASIVSLAARVAETAMLGAPRQKRPGRAAAEEVTGDGAIVRATEAALLAAGSADEG